MLDEDSRRELRSLSRETADLVARHLVMTGRLVDEDPEQALLHARAARALAGRIGVVRQAAGLAAYAAGEWADALSELRAARRITGRPEHLAVFADCERALGRPERALAYGDDPQVPSLSQDERVELVIVLAGARRDLGQADAAVLMLQDPAKRTTQARPWAVRLWYAYADALLEAGRDDAAREWFERTAGLDVDGDTDAADRLLSLDGIELDLGEDDEPLEAMDDELLQALVVDAFGEQGGRQGVQRPGPAPEIEARTAPEDASGSDAAGPVTPAGSVASAPVEVPGHLSGEDAGDVAPAAVVSAHHPFSESEARVTTLAGRPAAALTPTFAAPDPAGDDAAPDQAAAQASDDGPDDSELTLFE